MRCWPCWRLFLWARWGARPARADGQPAGMIPGPFAISMTAVAVQAVVALLSPLLAAILPIYLGARVTVREAISTYGLSSGSNWLDRLLVKFQALPRLVSLTLSNTFRNQKRVFFTQITLVGAGVMFMMVMNTRATLAHTFGDVLLSIFQVNILLDLEDEVRIKQVEALTLTHPEVTASRSGVRPKEQPGHWASQSRMMIAMSTCGASRSPRVPTCPNCGPDAGYRPVMNTSWCSARRWPRRLA
ncbi:MAG: hypothetical protein HS126_02365 [Anaerolineales bacterium]|nr:hypothetical protein [Anaerolineales bacterium]